MNKWTEEDTQKHEAMRKKFMPFSAGLYIFPTNILNPVDILGQGTVGFVGTDKKDFVVTAGHVVDFISEVASWKGRKGWSFYFRNAIAV